MSYQMPDPAGVNAMDGALSQLQRDLTTLGASLAFQDSGLRGIANWFEDKVADNTSQAQVTHDFEFWQGQASSLKAEHYPRVLGGTESLEGFLGAARALHQSITSTTDDTDNWAFSGVVSQTYQATKEEVKKDVAVGALIATPLLLGAGALYLFLLFGRRG